MAKYMADILYRDEGPAQKKNIKLLNCKGRSIVPLFNVYLLERYLFGTSKTFDGKIKTMDR